MDKSHNADSVFPSTFRYQLFDSLGIGDENKFEETVRKGTNTCDSACGDYLKKSTLTTSDVTSAKAVKSGSNYVITIGIKSGSGKNTPIDKSCICVGDERVSVNFDRKTTLSIASVLGFSNYENTRNGKVVATVNASTGEISKLVIIWDSGLKMQQDADEFVMFTTVTYTNFGW